MQMSRILAALTLAVATVTAAPALVGAAPLDSDQISDAAERVVQSVVNISTEREMDLGPWASDPFFNDPRSPFYMSPDERKQKSLGSGVLVNDKGRILTNAHVVGSADTVKVTLADGTELDAKIVGLDRRSDLAVIQLEGELPKLQPIVFGDSSKLRLGEVVLAVGNPFGVGQAVTMGIVSAKGRASLGITDYEDFIQTDAAINPGNSGGALVNLRGELVGINTAIYSQTGQYAGIGFAIPSDMASPIMKMLVEDGKVSRGYIGVTLEPLTREWIKEHKVAAKRGAVVKSVLAGSPASKAGIEEGDVITALDGAPVDDVGHLRNAIAMRGANAKVELQLVRGKATEHVTVKTAELPDKPTKKSKSKGAPAKRRR
jgi:serine protease Do